MLKYATAIVVSSTTCSSRIHLLFDSLAKISTATDGSFLGQFAIKSKHSWLEINSHKPSEPMTNVFVLDVNFSV